MAPWWWSRTDMITSASIKMWLSPRFCRLLLDEWSLPGWKTKTGRGKASKKVTRYTSRQGITLRWSYALFLFLFTLGLLLRGQARNPLEHLAGCYEQISKSEHHKI